VIARAGIAAGAASAADRPIALKRLVIRPGGPLKFVARGDFPLPDPAIDDPRTDGGALVTVSADPGATGAGTALFRLEASGWRGLGQQHDGSRGFRRPLRFTPSCSIVVRRKLIKGICRSSSGAIAADTSAAGPVHVV
jgi:hypothetical protein